MAQPVETHNKPTLTTATRQEIAAAQLEVERIRRWKQMKKDKDTPDKKCPHCEKVFHPSRDWQVYCSGRCRTDAYKGKLLQDVEALTAEVAILRHRNRFLEQRVIELEQK
jgi:uncharacterized OB-fold protein